MGNKKLYNTEVCLEMKVIKNNRKFVVGKRKNIILTDVGSIFLKDDENITLKNSKKKEYDICKKNWGYYGTPSLNKRLVKFGLEGALVKNKIFKTYALMIVEKTKKKSFFKYLKREDMILICWLSEINLKKISKIFKK